MKKLIAAAIIIIGGANSVLNAVTLQKINQQIKKAQDNATKQLLICEREIILFNNHSDNCNPQECLKVAKYFKELKKPNLLLSYSMSKRNQTFEEAKNLYIGESYLNAGLLFDYCEKSPKKAFESYKKGAKVGDVDAEFTTGLMYYFGVGVKKDKVKAYKWSLKAAKQGSQKAQKLLDTLCSESPWVCKQ